MLPLPESWTAKGGTERERERERERWVGGKDNFLLMLPLPESWTAKGGVFPITVTSNVRTVHLAQGRIIQLIAGVKEQITQWVFRQDQLRQAWQVAQFPHLRPTEKLGLVLHVTMISRTQL